MAHAERLDSAGRNWLLPLHWSRVGNFPLVALRSPDARVLRTNQSGIWLAPGNLRSTANMLRSHAEHCPEPSLREKYLLWSEACQMAAAEGGRQLTHELKPVWKDYVTNGSRL